MKYKVFIKRCENPKRAGRIAEEIAKRSGSPPQAVLAAIIEKSVCIKKDADEKEAIRLKEEFEALGAEVEFVAASATPPVPAASAGKDEDSDEEEGRTLTEAEFVAQLKARKDIFAVEKDTKLHYVEMAGILIGLVLAWLLSNSGTQEMANDFLDKIPEQGTVHLKKEDKKPEEDKTKITKDDKKKGPEAAPATSKPVTASRPRAAGDPRAHLETKGILAVISGKASSADFAQSDIATQGGFSNNIDAILSTGGLKTAGSSGKDRASASGIGFGGGFGGGGGGGGGIDDMIAGLMRGGGGGGGKALAMKHLKNKGDIAIPEPTIANQGGTLSGGRSRATIMRVVMQNLAALQYSYNKRLREKPGLRGKITCKFAIDEFGKVVFCKVIESTMDDQDLENEIVSKIKRWAFDKVDKPGDITEVVYPFVFSQ